MADPIVLRPILLEDLPELRAAIAESRDEVGPWLPYLLRGQEPAALREWFEAQARDRELGLAFHFAILSAADRALLGACGLTNLNRHHQFANVFYWVRTSATGQGAASAAARQLARFGFEGLGLQRVEIVVDVNNAASLRAAEKAGATREGVLRQRIRTGDKPCDAVMFSLIPADLR